MAYRSTGAERDLPSLEKLLECAICFETFTVPKKLQCDHTFCEKCLQELYNASGQPSNLTCPTCRAKTSVPANGIVGLRSDFRANEMKDAIESMTQRSRPQDNVCNPCEQLQKVVAAAWRCSTCDKKYCESCKRKHDRAPLFSRHEVRSILPSQNSTVTCPTCKVRLKELHKSLSL